MSIKARKPKKTMKIEGLERGAPSDKFKTQGQKSTEFKYNN